MQAVAFVALSFLLCSAQARRVRYHAQFSLQLTNLTYADMLASDQQLFVVDADDVKLTAEQNSDLRLQGKTVLAYLSVGDAETFRSYYQDSWKIGTPTFLNHSDPEYPNGVVVQFWQPEWQATVASYLMTNILPFGYSGLLMDYIDNYQQFRDVRPNAGDEMLQFVASLVSMARLRNPAALIVTQDALSLYPISEQYRMMIDGVSCEEVYYSVGKANSAAETGALLAVLREVANDKKVVMLEEYVEKNRAICDFYKKCSLEGFMCGVFGGDLTGVSRDCVIDRLMPL